MAESSIIFMGICFIQVIISFALFVLITIEIGDAKNELKDLINNHLKSKP